MFVLRTLTALALMVFLLGGAISHRPERGFVISLVTPAAAQDPALGVNPVARLRVGRPRWRRRGDLIYGDMTIRNANNYPVHNVTVECDFFGKWGNQVGTKAAEIQRVFARGRTRVRGIRFDVSVPNMQGGACHVVSATRVTRESISTAPSRQVLAQGGERPTAPPPGVARIEAPNRSTRLASSRPRSARYGWAEIEVVRTARLARKAGEGLGPATVDDWVRAVNRRPYARNMVHHARGSALY